MTGGVDPAAVTAWLAGAVDRLVPPCTFTLMAGGRSNLTYRVDDSAGAAFVLRRPPLGETLPTAHDVAREHRVLAALAGTQVPAPRPVALCADPAVNGKPFYVMELVPGHVLDGPAAAERWLPVGCRRRAAEQLVDAMAGIHAVDVDAVGLGDLARRDGYAQRQLRRWYAQYRASVDRGLAEVPLVDEVHDALAGRVPKQASSSLVHGDLHFKNVLVGEDGTVRAVLDWEVCTLGDPLADLGYLCACWPEELDDPMTSASPTALPGFPSRAWVVDRYFGTSGDDGAGLAFWLAFGYWKIACAAAAVRARYARGSEGGEGIGDEDGLVERIAESAHVATRRLC